MLNRDPVRYLERLRTELVQARQDENRNGSRDSRVPGLLARIEKLEAQLAAENEPRDWAYRLAEKIAPELGVRALPLARALRRETGGDLFNGE